MKIMSADAITFFTELSCCTWDRCVPFVLDCFIFVVLLFLFVFLLNCFRSFISGRRPCQESRGSSACRESDNLM